MKRKDSYSSEGSTALLLLADALLNTWLETYYLSDSLSNVTVAWMSFVCFFAGSRFISRNRFPVSTFGGN
jgi:hypothetical protein